MGRWVRWAAYTLIAMVAIYVVWRLSVFLVLNVFVGRAEAAIVERSQASHLLVRGLLLALAPLFIWSLTETFSLPGLWGGYKGSRRRRQVAKVLLVLSFAGYSLTLYAVSRGNFFTASGEAQKWCAERPDGVHCFDQPGFDPETGVPLKPVTSSEVIAWKRAELGQQPKRLSIEDIDSYNFVDSLQPNRPLVWYGLNRQLQIELFDGPGFHPVTGETLRPISVEVVNRYEAQLRRKQSAEMERRASEGRKLAREIEARERAEEDAKRAEEARRRQAMIERYVNQTAISAEPQVVVIDSVGSPDTGMAQRIASAIGGRTDLFRPAFVDDGLFGNALAGDAEGLRSLALQSSGKIYLFQKQSSVALTSREEGLHKAQTKIVGRRYDPRGGYSSIGLEAGAVGAAFTEVEAVRRSERHALDQLLTTLR